MPSPLSVDVEVDASRSLGAYRPIWNWFGYDEPNYTYTPNGKKLLKTLTTLSPEPVRIRVHNLLTSGDGVAALKWGSTNAYTVGPDGAPVYDWSIMDRIFDAFVEAGNVPLIQVGFTPEDLSDYEGPYRHSWSLETGETSITAGWAAPPNNLDRWSELVAAWARHLIERYGEDKVRTWPWEVWNEPDGRYWTGSIEEFCAMYDATVHAIRGVLPDAKVGGPHVRGPFFYEGARTFLRQFLAHVVKNKSPIDFIAFHAKGRPAVVDGKVRMGLSIHLNDISVGLQIVKEFPELAGLPVILGETDPEGCAACSARYFPQNDYRNGPLYSVYIIENMVRTYEISRQEGVEIEGAVTWSFLFEDQPYFDGFRDLATNGIEKAVLNSFRLLGMLGGDWVESRSSHAIPLEKVMSDSVRDGPDVNVAATRADDAISVLLWNYHDDDTSDHAAGTAEIAVTLRGIDWPSVSITAYRIDHEHSNAHAVWKRMGSPQSPTEKEYEALVAASALEHDAPVRQEVRGGEIQYRCAIPRQGVVLLRVEPA
ncbi:beta-xylosidase [Aureimonas altamirensis]|uniref:Beta-xylosidase n=1 Tax=Aureimonas altamirensis TaxID=370622 RepID=A0A0B1Q6Q9_9HYPH|nr:beta-xylosidase [Aureimonas altamirensis]KHJ56069.1 beta-xylosidase [Aureimonas altamirensis]